MQGNERQVSSGNGHDEHGKTTDSPIRKRRTKIAAAFLFALTTVSSLIVQDLYAKAKNTVDPSPFDIFVEPDDECPRGNWLFPTDFNPKTLPGFNRFDSRWAYENGGYTTKESITKLTFQAKTEDAVVLRGMRVIVTERKDPMGGLVISKCPTINKSTLDVRRFEINLDDPEPSLVPQDSSRDKLTGASDGSHFRGFPYKISQSDPEMFHLTARTTKCICSWSVQLDWTASGEPGTTTINIGSSLFRTAAPDGAETLYYRPDGTLHK